MNQHLESMPAAHRLTILVIFTVSGCTGLIYQSVWSHYLGLYLGHAAYAQTLTLGIFMGGLTLGAYIVSLYIDRIRNALMGYAIAELVLGIAGLLFHAIYTGLVAFSYDTVFPGLANPGLISTYKWLSGALVILPQSILLGATFPLICSALPRREQQGIGHHISILYFTNSMGAAAGALVATFVLIPSTGMPGAMMTSGLLNLLIAAITYGIAKQPEHNQSDVQETQPKADANAVKLDKVTVVVLIASAITGAVSFMYEIAWIRMLNLVLGSSLHAFEIMLSAFIAGLALGGWWIRNRIDKIPDLLRFTGQVQIFMGLAAISTLVLYAESFGWIAILLNATLLKTETGYVFYNLATSLLSGLIMIPATFCAGMTLPLLTTHLIRQRHNENAIGRVYASNTIGAILGIVAAVHIGMTTLGLKWLIVVAGLIDIGLGLYLIFYTGRSLKWVSIPSRALAVFLIGLASVSLLTELTPERLASGTFRYARADVNSDILFYKDGKTASISVQRFENDVVNITTNGKPDAGLRIDRASGNAVADEITMSMLGSIGHLINPDVRSAANIGFGSGLTSHVMLGSDKLETLDTIEIEPVMVEGARIFMDRNHKVFEDPRSTIHYEDAKTFFATHQKVYDVIVSVPSNPWVAGVGNLFTVEFYDHIKRYLNDDGIFVQWLQLYEISMPTLLTALGALNEGFPNYQLYAATNGDILIVATPNANTDLSIKTSWDQLPDALRTDLEYVGINNIEQVKSRRFASKYEIDALVKVNQTASNSDYFPLLSLNAPKDRFIDTDSTELTSLQLLSISDFPFKNNYLVNFEQEVDQYHPYGKQILESQKLTRFLHSKPRDNDLDFLTVGKMLVLRSPEQFCDSATSGGNWVNAFFVVAAEVNKLKNAELRKSLLEIADRFQCVDMLEPHPRGLYNAALISLGDFQPDSSTKLRNILLDEEMANIKQIYRSFIISVYMASLIDRPDAIQEADLVAINSLRDKFNLTNVWLEGLLHKQLAGFRYESSLLSSNSQ